MGPGNARGASGTPLEASSVDWLAASGQVLLVPEPSKHQEARWVALPLPMQGRAARVFSLVSEAYAAISKGLVEQQRAAERLETTGDSSGSDDSALPDTILIGYGRVGCDDGSTRCKVH